MMLTVFAFLFLIANASFAFKSFVSPMTATSCSSASRLCPNGQTMTILDQSSLSMSIKSSMDSSDSRSDASIIKTRSMNLVRTILFTSLPTLGTSLVAMAADGSGDYVDIMNGFKVIIPPAWASMPRKVPPPPTMTQFQTENVVLVANSFVEGAALSVTRANAGRLLKDFEIEWWFAPLEKFKDVGDSKLVAELMILQRQGEFEKKQTSSEITKARFVDENVLEFEYITPLAAEVNRKTICKAYFLPKSKEIKAIWVSALTGVFESDYGETLNGVAQSFELM